VTEYSGMRFLFFFFAEWGNLYVIGAIATTLFLGGWQIPPVTDHPVLKGILEFIVFFLKAYLWVFVAMWVRGTLPRVRVDQLMAMCWKYMVPLSLLGLMGAAAWVAVWPQGNRVASMAMFLIGLVILADHFVGVPLTGASMNPARSFGPALVANFWDDQWVYWLGPLIGAGLAALVYEYVFMQREE